MKKLDLRGQAGGSYWWAIPQVVNAARQQGKWQTFGIISQVPKYDGTKQIKPAVISLLHNGIMVHHRELTDPTGLAGDPK